MYVLVPKKRCEFESIDDLKRAKLGTRPSLQILLTFDLFSICLPNAVN